MTNSNRPTNDDHDADTPYARKVEQESGKPDQLRDRLSESESRQDALQDEALEETFPASDPPTPKRIT